MDKDFLNQYIDIGDFVVAAYRSDLGCYKIIKITPKMFRIVNINAKTKEAKKGKLRYGQELLKIDAKLVTYVSLLRVK